MGVSPWKTLLDLYEDKTAEEINEESNFVMEMGNLAEPLIRQAYSELVGINYRPDNWAMEGFPIMASLDGISECKKKIIEIKTCNQEDYQDLLDGKCPKKYFPQLQQQLLVTGITIGWVVGYPISDFRETKAVDPKKLAICTVIADPTYQKELADRSVAFWNNHVVPRVPPEPTERDYRPLKGTENLGEIYSQLTKEIEALEQKREALKAGIIREAELVGHKRLLVGSLKLTKIARKGNVQYFKIEALKGIDLEKYRAKSTEYWKLG